MFILTNAISTLSHGHARALCSSRLNVFHFGQTRPPPFATQPMHKVLLYIAMTVHGTCRAHFCPYSTQNITFTL